MSGTIGLRATPSRLLDVAVATLLVGAVLLPLGTSRAASDQPVLLNEVLISPDGTPDTAEFAELYGTPGTSLAGLSLLVVEGDSSGGPGTVDQRLDFAASATLGGNGFFLVGNPAGLGSAFGVVPDVPIGNDWFENGSQTVALVETASAPAAGGTVTGSETVLDAVGFTDTGASDVWFFDAPVMGPDDGFLPAGARRVPDGGDWVLADFQLPGANSPTPATSYDAPPAVDCGDPINTTAGIATQATVSAADPDGRVTSFALSVAPDPGTVTLGVVSAAATAGDTASTEVVVAASTPAGAYALTVTARTDAATPQQASCELALTVADAPTPPEPTGTPDLISMLHEQMDTGGVAAGKAHLLTDRLARVERFLAEGRDAAAAAQLRAFANQALGLSPRWVTDAAAQELAAMATDLADSLTG